MSLAYQTKQASPGELMATSDLWTCSDGTKSNYVQWISQSRDHTAGKSCTFKVLLLTAASEPRSEGVGGEGRRIEQGWQKYTGKKQDNSLFCLLAINELVLADQYDENPDIPNKLFLHLLSRTK